MKPSFGLRQLFIAVAIVALGVVLARRAYVAFRGNYEPFAARVRSVNSICDTRVLGDYEEGTRNVEVFTFRIRDNPQSFVELWSPDCDLFDDASNIWIAQIGKTRVSSSHRDPSTGYSGGGAVDFSPTSRVKKLLPFTIRNLDELIERYDELDAYLSVFSEGDSLGVVNVTDTHSIEVHAYPNR